MRSKANVTDHSEFIGSRPSVADDRLPYDLALISRSFLRIAVDITTAVA
jgi:hypothetical protein